MGEVAAMVRADAIQHAKNYVTTEYYLVLKKKEILTEAATGMNLENIRPNGISQAQKDKYCMVPLI